MNGAARQLDKAQRLLLTPHGTSLAECEAALRTVVAQSESGHFRADPSTANTLAGISRLLESAKRVYETVMGVSSSHLVQYQADGALRVSAAAPSFAIEV